jgi:hypothetical protein
MKTTSYSSYLKRSLGSYDHSDRLTVTSGGKLRTLMCIVCILVWHRDDGRWSDRDMSVNSTTWSDTFYRSAFVGLLLSVTSLGRMIQNHNTHTAHCSVPWCWRRSVQIRAVLKQGLKFLLCGHLYLKITQPPMILAFKLFKTLFQTFRSFGRDMKLNPMISRKISERNGWVSSKSSILALNWMDWKKKT